MAPATSAQPRQAERAERVEGGSPQTHIHFYGDAATFGVASFDSFLFRYSQKK